MKLYDPNTGTNSLDIVAANNYYPFGMLMPDGCYAADLNLGAYEIQFLIIR